MPDFDSALFELREISGAGRGLIAKTRIAQDTLLLICAEPAIHVIFREYRKEVCAQCFHYDRGRNLPVKANDVGKVFCSDECHRKWLNESHFLVVKAWQDLEIYIKANGKHIREMSAEMLSERKPTNGDITSRWHSADQAITRNIHVRTQAFKDGKQQKPSSIAKEIYPDILALELSTVIHHRLQQEVWVAELESLAMDPIPYKSIAELALTCTALVQLSSILPLELIDSCKSSVSLQAAAAGSHNAFGLRSGGEDNEEYMGWAIYPQASYFNHSCSPNVSKRRHGRAWHFRTARDVAAGEQLCISYLGGDERDLSVSERRTRLENVWGFICMCSRCQAEAND